MAQLQKHITIVAVCAFAIVGSALPAGAQDNGADQAAYMSS